MSFKEYRWKVGLSSGKILSTSSLRQSLKSMDELDAGMMTCIHEVWKIREISDS